MPAYMIFIREGEIIDPAAMETYRNSNRSNPLHSTMKPVAVYGTLETMEGDAADGVVILEFPTMEDARAWYYSPGYQEATEHRKKAAPYRVMLVEGL